jgi:2-hydroxy-3-keto-5-methylthiopentenyl-1-phosphate phosphatase
MSSIRPAASGASPDPADLAILIDYDGTIATVDVTDELVRRASSREEWLKLELAYRQGLIGSRSLLEAEARLLPHDPSELEDVLRDQRHDPAFASFVAACQAIGAVVEVVSDGLGFFVGPGIAALEVGEIPVYAAALKFGPLGPQISFPHGNPACSVCGTCKRSRVLSHQTAGRHVVYVGDGYSDQYAISYADTVFAKGDLVGICRDREVAFEPWSTFDDVREWLMDRHGRRGLGSPTAHPFVCGPEAWADGSGLQRAALQPQEPGDGRHA